ncbi:MAG: YkgJ family cysteine cluster protein [Vicinamibacteria bacterium]|nr:YkgJ family cysteine cluster protein [Vicinamibacteria bacterium]
MNRTADVEAFHAAVDAAANRVAAAHGSRLRCGRGCSSCCVDGITVFAVEAERIRAGAPELLAEGEPGPEGTCAFLDADGACRVYALRPYVCRTQGLPLRWVEEDEADPGTVVEQRDICPLNDETGPPLTELPPDRCWTLGPWEERLRALQEAFDGPLARVPLRSLFARSRR